MKKIISSILILFVLFTSLDSCDLFSDASMFYNESAEVNGLAIEINRKANKCFAGMYPCFRYEENMEITIPDSYDGVPLTQLGGYVGTGVPTPFYISISESHMVEEDKEFAETYGYNPESYTGECEYSVEEVVFILNLGKNISEIECVYEGDCAPHVNEDNSVTFYRPVVYIVCAEENRHFYSEDGKLYSKETKELIEGFAYASDYE